MVDRGGTRSGTRTPVVAELLRKDQDDKLQRILTALRAETGLSSFFEEAFAAERPTNSGAADAPIPGRHQDPEGNIQPITVREFREMTRILDVEGDEALWLLLQIRTRAFIRTVQQPYRGTACDDRATFTKATLARLRKLSGYAQEVAHLFKTISEYEEASSWHRDPEWARQREDVRLVRNGPIAMFLASTLGAERQQAMLRGKRDPYDFAPALAHRLLTRFVDAAEHSFDDQHVLKQHSQSKLMQDRTDSGLRALVQDLGLIYQNETGLRPTASYKEATGAVGGRFLEFAAIAVIACARVDERCAKSRDAIAKATSRRFGVRRTPRPTASR